MKKILLLTFVLFAIYSCKQTPEQIAEKCLYEHAYHPQNLMISSWSIESRPEEIRTDTFYHIAFVDGRDGHKKGLEWWNATAIYTDSIRIDTRIFPEYTYCNATIECVSDCGEVTSGVGEVSILSNGEAMLYIEYLKKYSESKSSEYYAKTDTFINVRSHIELFEHDNGWIYSKMIYPFSFNK